MHAFSEVVVDWLTFIQSQALFCLQKISSNQRHACTFEAFEAVNKAFQTFFLKTDTLFYLIFTFRFPSKLRSMCHCLFQVVNQRFQQSTVEAVWTVIGTVIFLRFINPAIGITIFTVDVVIKPCIVLVFSFWIFSLFLIFVSYMYSPAYWAHLIPALMPPSHVQDCCTLAVAHNLPYM